MTGRLSDGELFFKRLQKHDAVSKSQDLCSIKTDPENAEEFDSHSAVNMTQWCTVNTLFDSYEKYFAQHFQAIFQLLTRRGFHCLPLHRPVFIRLHIFDYL